MPRVINSNDGIADAEFLTISNASTFSVVDTGCGFNLRIPNLVTMSSLFRRDLVASVSGVTRQ